MMMDDPELGGAGRARGVASLIARPLRWAANRSAVANIKPHAD